MTVCEECSAADIVVFDRVWTAMRRTKNGPAAGVVVGRVVDMPAGLSTHYWVTIQFDDDPMSVEAAWPYTLCSLEKLP